MEVAKRYREGSEMLVFFLCQKKGRKTVPTVKNYGGSKIQERGSGGVQSTGVSQSVRATSRDESQSVPSLEKLF